MKKLILITALVLSGCVHYIPYHSTVGNTRYTKSTSTDMILIPENSDLFSQHGEFGVIAAIDDSLGQKNYYIILAPAVSSYPTTINVCDLSHSCSILPSEANDILRHLSNMIKEWDTPTADSEAKFYEFTTRTEMPVPSNMTFLAMRNFMLESSGPNEEGWVPTVDLTYNRTSRGSDMTIQIGGAKSSYRFEIKNLKEVESLQDQLQRALLTLKKSGMQ